MPEEQRSRDSNNRLPWQFSEDEFRVFYSLTAGDRQRNRELSRNFQHAEASS
ncbi:MAG: hypothetical protein IID44_27110 [Planctomycetes bacterium]|nr:hypothetical protein [Planctomycetota bacterium]